MPKKPLKERLLDAEAYGSRALADGNEAAERGNKQLAEKYWAKAQFWLDRYNFLAGKGEKAPPRE